MSENAKYRSWKSDYDVKHKRAKRLYFVKLGAAILVMILLYYWYTGRLKFFAQPTGFTTGVITKTRPWRTGPGGGFSVYIQYADYKYEVKGEEHNVGFFPDRSIGEMHEGDTVKIKYSRFFNGLSEVVEVLYCIKEK